MTSHPIHHLKHHLSRLFGRGSCRLQAAALPWRRAGDGVEIMLITSRDTGRWVLPKGWPEEGEEFWQAAAREAVEEAGLEGIIADREIGRYFYAKNRSSRGDLACEVHVFPLKVKHVADTWKEARQRTRRWMSPVDAAAAVKEQDLSALIAAFGADPACRAA